MTNGSEPQGLRLLAYSDSRIFSGAEAVLRDVVEGLSRRPGFSVRCAAPSENAALTDALEEASGEPVIDVPAQPLRLAALHLYDPRRRRAAARAVEAADPDLLLVNLPSAEYGATPVTAGRVPSVGFLHVPGSPRRLGFRLGWLRERLARRALRGLDAVCVLTDSAERAYEDLWRADGTLIRSARLLRPQLAAVPKEEARARLGLPAGPVVGLAGRVSMKQKGHDTFADAAAILAERDPEIRFAVAGTGRDSGRFARLVHDRGLEQRFHMLGHVEPISVFLSAIDAIALPSRFEGLPFIALEALALEVPGVAASIDGLGDIWPRQWQVAADDPTALAEALLAVLDSGADERRRLLAEGQAQAERHTSDDVAADVGRVLEEVVGAA